MTQPLAQISPDTNPLALSMEAILSESQTMGAGKKPRLITEAPESFSTAPAKLPSGEGFQNQYPIKLWGQACTLASIPAVSSQELELAEIPLNQSAPLPSFDLHNATQSCMAQQLSAFLDEMYFDEINQWVHPRDYGKTPIYDTKLTADDAAARLAKLKEASPKEKSAFLFFTYGQSLSAAELTDVFSDHPELFAQMKTMNLIVAEPSPDQVRYRLNDLSLASQKLPNGETLYLFVDLPARLQPHPTGETSAQLSGTSYNLLQQLMSDYRNGKNYSGIAADFGAGTGIQGLALLKLYPRLTTAISLEIDERSMNLNRFNALLNGVADRVQVVDNADPKNLTAALAGRQLDLAVSNPPFNTLPHEYEGKLTHFGYGGDYGIDVTKIFLHQAMPVLKKNAEFIFYSFLAEDEKNHYYVAKFLQQSFLGLTAYFNNLNPTQFRYLERAPYAQTLAEFMHKHGEAKSDTAAMAKDIEARFKERGVGRISEKIVRIVNRGDDKAVTVIPPVAYDARPVKDDSLVVVNGNLEQERKAFALDMGGERATRLGGVYFRRESQPGGVFLEAHVADKLSLSLDQLLKGTKTLEKCLKDPKCGEQLKKYSEAALKSK